MRAALFLTLLLPACAAFSTTRPARATVSMAQISQAQASKVIDAACKKLKNDKEVVKELGTFSKSLNVLGFGEPRAGVIQVRFNAQFKKGGGGPSLPFGLGKPKVEKDSQGRIKGGPARGAMVGQVKAAADAKSGKIIELSVFKDLGYGKSVNVRC